MGTRTAHVLLLCGLPGSGKSSLARALGQSNERSSSVPLFDRVVHIEYDSVTRDLQQNNQVSTSAAAPSSSAVRSDNTTFDDHSLEAWRSSRKVALARLDRELRNHFENDDSEEHTDRTVLKSKRLLVVLDDNFHLRSMRKNCYQLCQSHAIDQRLFFLILWLDVPVAECLGRNRLRPTASRVPDETIRAMAFEPPDPQKASWEKGWVHCTDEHKVSMLEVVLKQSQVVVPPPPPVDPTLVEEERRKTRESRLHTYDGYLRAWVGVVARIRRSDAGKANSARKSILQELRTGAQHHGSTIADEQELVMKWFQDQVGVPEWTEEEINELTNDMQSIVER